MSYAARVALAADRYTPCVRKITFRGLDLTGVALRMQWRLAPDTPGAPLVDLQTVNYTYAEGLKLLSVEVTDGYPVSVVQIRVNKTTMKSLPYSGELGDATALAYDLIGTLGNDERVLMGGEVSIGAGVTGADDAPLNRPFGYSRAAGAGISGMRIGATLEFGENDIVVTIDGADLLAPLVKQAQDARDAVKPLMGTGAPAANIGIVGSAYYDVTDWLNPVFYGPKTSAGWGVGRGLKGSAGGNVMAIGPLSSASALAIGAGAALVQTSSHSAPGDRGGARYERVDGAAVAAGLPGTFTSTDTGQRWQLAEVTFNAAFFGYRGDDTGAVGSNNRQALLDCIAAAKRLRVRSILFPWGSTGQGRFDGSIVDGDLSPGMRFIGEARGDPNGEFGPGVRLRYTGDKALWNIVPGGGSSGWWTWEDLVFICDDPKASAFDFNSTATHGVVSDTSAYSYAELIEWKRCRFYGAHGGAAQNGDGIRGAKVMNSAIGTDCYARGWRHAVWFKGCDNNKIGMRCELNGQHIRLEASGTFTNDNTVDAKFLGNTSEQSSVPQVAIYDSGNRTTFLNNSFENASPNAMGAYYLNGHGTVVQGPQFACKFWVAGPFAREVKIHDPHVRKYMASWQPTYEAPASWNFGGNQSDYRLRASGMSHNARAIIGDHPRLINGDLDAMPDSRPSQFVAMARGAGGILAPKQQVLSALNWGWQNNEGTEASAGIAGMMPDATASTGWAIRMAAVMNGGLSAERVIGRDIPPSWVTITTRTKVAATGGWVALVKRIRANGTVVTEAHPLTYGTGGGYNVDRFAIDLRTWALGDRFVYLVYNAGAANGNIDLDYLSIDAVEPPVAPAGDTVTPAAFNALLDMLRSAAVMA